MRDEIREKKLAVYLALGMTVAVGATYITTDFVLAARNKAGSGFGDTTIIKDDPNHYFERTPQIGANNR